MRAYGKLHALKCISMLVLLCYLRNRTPSLGSKLNLHITTYGPPVMHSNFQLAAPHAVEASTLSCLLSHLQLKSKSTYYCIWRMAITSSNAYAFQKLLASKVYAARKLLIVSIVLMTIVLEHTAR